MSNQCYPSMLWCTTSVLYKNPGVFIEILKFDFSWLRNASAIAQTCRCYVCTRQYSCLVVFYVCLFLFLRCLLFLPSPVCQRTGGLYDRPCDCCPVKFICGVVQIVCCVVMCLTVAPLSSIASMRVSMPVSWPSYGKRAVCGMNVSATSNRRWRKSF